MWHSDDGVDWTVVATFNQDVGQVSNVDGRLFATLHTGELAEWNGESFVTITPIDVLSGPESWHINAFSADGDSIAALMTGYNETEMMHNGPDPVIVVADNGRTVEVDDMSGSVMVLDGNEILLRVRMWESASDAIQFDIDAGTVSFIDPSTSEELAVVSIEALTDAQMSTYSSEGMTSRSVLLSTTDGFNWSITDLNEVAGAGFHGESVILSAEEIVVLGRDHTGYSFDEVPPYRVLVARR